MFWAIVSSDFAKRDCCFFDVAIVAMLFLFLALAADFIQFWTNYKAATRELSEIEKTADKEGKSLDEVSGAYKYDANNPLYPVSLNAFLLKKWFMVLGMGTLILSIIILLFS